MQYQRLVGISSHVKKYSHHNITLLSLSQVSETHQKQIAKYHFAPTILNKENKVVSNIGGTEPIYENGKLKTMAQADKIFAHPHDVCVDDEGSIYVAQWASGKVYPYKLTRV